jgi:hypothetical protein
MAEAMRVPHHSRRCELALELIDGFLTGPIGRDARSLAFKRPGIRNRCSAHIDRLMWCEIVSSITVGEDGCHVADLLHRELGSYG